MTVIRPRPLGHGLRHRPFSEPAPLPASVSPQAPRYHSSEHTWARRYRTRLIVTDSLIVVGSVIAAFILRFGLDDVVTSVAGFPIAYAEISAVIAATWLIALAAYHTRDSRVVGVGLTEYRRLVSASVITFGTLAIAFLVTKVDVARGYFVLALPLGAAALLSSRWLWRQWLLKQRRYNHYLSRALVVGDRGDVEYVVRQIQQKSGAAYNVVGAAIDEQAGKLRLGDKLVPVVCGLDGVTEAAGDLRVDTVILASQPREGGAYTRNLGWALEGTATDLVLASRLTDVAGPRIHFRPVEGLPLIHVEIPQFEGGKHVLKRLFDIAASGTALLLLLPLMLVVGLAVRLDSTGPALFFQDRVGRNGSTFRMLKFRSMVQDAELRLARLTAQNEGAGVLFKMKDDPRVTRIGRILRKFSIDELPQLWNVLVGDMSLVGPRPPLRREVDDYETHVHRRLYIRPGLTGMWQVNGRSDLSWDESVRLDLYYVENWSLTGDIVILWRTLRVLIHPSGAY